MYLGNFRVVNNRLVKQLGPLRTEDVDGYSDGEGGRDKSDEGRARTLR